MNTSSLKKNMDLIKIIFNFIWAIPLQILVQYIWITIQNGRRDSFKCDHDCLIRLKITVINGGKVWNFEIDRWIQGDRLMVSLAIDKTDYHVNFSKFANGSKSMKE